MNTYLECWSLSSIRGRTAGIISRGKIWLTTVNAMHTSTRLVLCKSCYNHWKNTVIFLLRLLSSAQTPPKSFTSRLDLARLHNPTALSITLAAILLSARLWEVSALSELIRSSCSLIQEEWTSSFMLQKKTTKNTVPSRLCSQVEVAVHDFHVEIKKLPSNL